MKLEDTFKGQTVAFRTRGEIRIGKFLHSFKELDESDLVEYTYAVVDMGTYSNEVKLSKLFGIVGEVQ